MKANLIPVVIATILFSLAPINAYTLPPVVDNTIVFSGPFGLLNPCNGELVTGDISVHIVVTSTQTGNGDVKVNIHHTSHGLLTGNQGNEYQVSRHAKAQFDAVSNSYLLNWRGDFVGKGSAPNFSADAQLRVFTNADNEPVGSQGLSPINRTCD